jgi:NAD-dependent histone deacetylase SIR2
MIKTFAETVRSRDGVCVFMNMTPPSKEWDGLFDHVLLGPCDDSIEVISALTKTLHEMSEGKKKTRKVFVNDLSQINKEKKDEKLAKEMAATSDIKQFFKVVKKEFIASTKASNLPSKIPTSPAGKGKSSSHEKMDIVSTRPSSSASSKSLASNPKSKIPTPVKKGAPLRNHSSNSNLNETSPTKKKKMTRSAANLTPVPLLF